MSDLIDQGAPEYFVDGWDDRENREGIFGAAAYRVINGQRHVVFRFVQRASALASDVAETQAVLQNSDQSHGLTIALRCRLPN